MTARHTRIAIPLALTSLLLLSGCSLLPAAAPDAQASPSSTPTPSASSSTDSGAGDVSDALAERDEFFAAQQQLPGESTLVARTEAQKELVANQRAYVESQGVTWSTELESITLALGLDACETSILNSHTVDVNTFQSHVATSPLISALAGEDAAAQAGVVSIMIYGTGFLCPDDAPQWQAAAGEAGF
ncbi:hypothetical protein LQ938_07760 [Microbacterium sp. cx-55]|uniref:hypothetical protein n=1 Tax=Microbacterium sp. cx-55 TaxID=2875948 RepID=UPI001CBB22F9|nr:hypothetical protein [Microbacterium sp. cx-55]MBZ4486357.1 hypothetical protein [Microbacterium sp. cx-55]UGB33804.1 hypothetical protein LQ938_07760 [Microbacterium sp. cx-55]